MQAQGVQAPRPFGLQQSHLQHFQSQGPFQIQGLPGQAIDLAPTPHRSLADQFMPYMEQRYQSRLASQISFDNQTQYAQQQAQSTLQTPNTMLPSSGSSHDNFRLNTPQRSDMPSTASDRSFEGVFPTALTPMSWSGISENRTAPPSPGSFAPFSPIVDNDEGGFDGAQMKEENDVLGILAGLTCDDEEAEGEEEKMIWKGAEVAKDFGPIGQERRNSAAEGA